MSEATAMTTYSTTAATNVLVVEDDDEIRMMLDLLLTRAGYHPTLVESGEAALAYVDQEPTDLIVLDLRLPGMSGYDVCRRIRESNASSMPILMITANQEQTGVVKGLGLGADDYLRKPFDPDELLSRIAVLLRRHRAAETLVTENDALRRMLDSVQGQLQSSQVQSATENLLRREFLHNVTTHLQALCGVVEAEYRRQASPPVREVVQRILGRVRGAALVYETSEVLQEDPVRVEGLVHTIATALKHIYSPRKRLPISIEGGQLQLPLPYAAPLAMIINELVTNCFKHAFPQQRFGAITVRYTYEPGEFVIEVADDGVGIEATGGTPGRGMATVQSLAQQLDGTADWSSTMGSTRVTVRFPIDI
jgi:DNA-binding response OmpR family regulator